MKANRKEKAAKVKAQAKVQATVEVNGRTPVVPQASAYTAPKAVVQPWHKVTEVIEEVAVVTVNQEKFNRAGFDMLMDSLAGDGMSSKAIAETLVEKKSVKARIGDGFLGMTRRMYRRGCNGQEILEANVTARLETGRYSKEQAMVRAKKDYGYVVREAKTEKKSDAPVATQDVAVNS